MNDVISGDGLVLWLSLGVVSSDRAMHRMESLLEAVLGIELEPGSDLELGCHASFEAEPPPERGTLHVIVQDNPADDPVRPERAECSAVAKVTMAGDLLDLGRLADRVTRAGGDSLVLLAWGFHEPVLGPDVVVAALGEIMPGDPGRPTWLPRIEPGGSDGHAPRAGLWLCQLAAGMGGASVEEALIVARELLDGQWAVTTDLHGPEPTCVAIDPRDLTASLRLNQFEEGAPLFRDRSDHVTILRLSWLAPSPLELGWLAAALERRRIETLSYRMSGVVTSDGVVRLMTGRPPGPRDAGSP